MSQLLNIWMLHPQACSRLFSACNIAGNVPWDETKFVVSWRLFMNSCTHRSSIIESTVSQCINIRSIRTTSQAVSTALRRGQKVYRALDQTVLQSGLVQESNHQASTVYLCEAASPWSNWITSHFKQYVVGVLCHKGPRPALWVVAFCWPNQLCDCTICGFNLP